MKENTPYALGHNIYLIDGFYMGVSQVAGSYVICDEHLTLIDTSASPSVPRILAGLKALQLAPEQVEYIIVTHIHLDPAGGAGLLLQHCPQAKVVVHPRGARHLADPSRLIESSKAIYKEAFSRLFDPIVPIPQERLIIKGDGETLTIGPGRTLRFLDTPGHARHHFCIYDPKSKGIFSGDTLGCRYPKLEALGGKLFVPVTTPNHFDPEAMKNSIERIMELELEGIYFGHFGMSQEVDEVHRQLLYWLDIYVSEGERAYQEGLEVEKLAERLLNRLVTHHRELNLANHKELYSLLRNDTSLSAMGIYDYLQKVKG